ncbi:MAG TPA: TIGR02281 family clan AA aspartic protease [Roseiarcus sp.]|nr:TIGR02281 family clan AA aspartic protease [Roseiarcus sp.]
MRYLLPIGILVLAGLLLLAVPAETPLLGLDHKRFAFAALGAALFTAFLSRIGSRRVALGDLARALGGALIWLVLIVGLTGVYAYRFEFGDIADRVIAELSPGDVTIGKGGEVIVPRRLGGQFIIAAKVDNVPTSFLFDTGASTVVLRAEDARKMGVDVANLDYDVDVTTANGATRAAEAVLDRIAIGPIVVRNVHALIARPGALNENLLGANFLDRLQSYSVERGRLVLKGR